MKAEKRKLLVLGALFASLVLVMGCAGGWSRLNAPQTQSEPASSAQVVNGGQKQQEVFAEEEENEKSAGQSPAQQSVKGKAPEKRGEESYLQATEPPPYEPAAETGGEQTREASKKGGAEKTASTPEPIVGKTRRPAESSGDSGQIVLNFDNADLYEVIRTIAELLEINYVLEPGVGGKVTIHTAGKLNRRDLFPVFNQILEVNGLTAVKEGSLYRIVPFKDSPRMPIVSRLDRRGKELPPEERIIIQLIPLKFISAGEMTKLLSPFLSSGGTILAHDTSNTLLVVDKTLNVLKVLRLVDAFDVDVFEKVGYRFYTLENFEAENLAEILREVFASYRGAGKADLKFVGIERLNTLLAVSSNPHVFDRIEAFIDRIDLPSEEAEPRIFVYFVKNGKAEQLAKLLKSIFREKDAAKGKPAGPRPAGRRPTNPLDRDYLREKKAQEAEAKTEQKSAPEPGEASAPSAAPGSLRGEINITADEVRNALVIEASPRDYRIIETILTRLDVLPRQVLIEVMVAEITLDEQTELGIEWTYTKDVEVGTGLLSATVGEAGLNYAVGIADKVKGVISAMASENKVNILSTPSVLASDNKEAQIDISTEVPVASSQFTYTTGEEPLTETTIQYRDTGVLLTVTPHINERGLVTMDITQEVSEQTDSNVKVGGQEYPAFFKRSVNTSLTVKHGQTIVIGGLIKETSTGGAKGVPWLVDVPVIRYLFGKESESMAKTELIILITPHVITSLEDVDAVTEEFRNKVDRVMKNVQRE